MSHDYSDYEDRSEKDNILSRISDAVRRQRSLEIQVEECKKDLERAKKSLELVSMYELPNLMEEARQNKITTDDGFEVEIKEDIFGNIPKDKLPQALAWLEMHGGGALIKHKIQVELAKGEGDKAFLLEEALKGIDNDLEIQTTSGVHPMTLRSFLRHKLQEGEDIPMETFGVFHRKEAKIKIKGI